jgi:predicted metal-dependent phosphoesterase TrpH
MKYDLHIHSHFSACADKENTIEKLLELAEKNKLDVISITDHNTCITHLMNMYKDYSHIFSGKIITGMECDICEDGMGIEAIAYNFDPIKLFNYAYKTYGTLASRQTIIKDTLIELIKKHNLDIDYSVHYNPKTDYAHHYIYTAMKDSTKNQQFFLKYNIKDVSDLYRLSMSDKNFPLFVDKSLYTPNLSTLIQEVHKAGGIVILAHPYFYKHIDGEYILNLATKYGADGIEVYHPSATKEQVAHMLEFAKKHSLKVSGGSDYHGTPRRSDIGIHGYKDEDIHIDLI